MIKFVRRVISEYKEYLLLIILSIVSLTVLSSNEQPQVKKIRTFAFGTFAFCSEVINSVTGIFKSGYSRDELLKENAELMLEINRLRKLGSENKELHSMLNYKDTTRFPLIAADVVSKLVNKIEGNFIINKGYEDGLQKGMPVITHRGLVGVVADVGNTFSTVRTIYNSNLNIAVTIQRINVDGILSWDGKELIIKNIPTTYELNVGDTVETSDFSTLFPPAVPIGVVSKKEDITLGLLHTISVKPFADIYSVHDVFILKSIPNVQINQLEMNLMKR